MFSAMIRVISWKEKSVPQISQINADQSKDGLKLKFLYVDARDLRENRINVCVRQRFS